MKTAMQQILEKCNDENLSTEDIGRWISAYAYVLFEKERQQIIDAYVKGCYDTYGNDEHNPLRPDSLDGKNYYKETYDVAQ